VVTELLYVDGKQTDRQADMLKLTVTFCKFANAPNKSGIRRHVLSIAECCGVLISYYKAMVLL
jgi:hypothetical protein